jgi:hypothetical protein
MVMYILSEQEKAKAAVLAAEVLGTTEPIELACQHVVTHLTGGPKLIALRQDGDTLLCRNCSPL